MFGVDGAGTTLERALRQWQLQNKVKDKGFTTGSNKKPKVKSFGGSTTAVGTGTGTGGKKNNTK